MGRVIGIDPDAAGFVCALVDEQLTEVATKRFSVRSEDLEGSIRWHRSQRECIVALEGIHGQSRPIGARLLHLLPFIHEARVESLHHLPLHLRAREVRTLHSAHAALHKEIPGTTESWDLAHEPNPASRTCQRHAPEPSTTESDSIRERRQGSLPGLPLLVQTDEVRTERPHVSIPEAHSGPGGGQ